MNPQEISYIRYEQTNIRIEKHDEIQSALKDAYELTKSVKKERDKSKNNPSRYQELNNMLNSFIREYADLERSIINAINDDKKITKKEEARIMFELSDIVNLAEQNWIIESKSKWSRLWDRIRKTDTKKAKEKASDLRDKNINEYTKDETIAALEYLNDNYKKGSWAKESTLWNRAAINYHSINQLDDFWEVNMFQELLLEKILWKWQWFNNEYIAWFDEGQWNYITKITDFENKLSWARIDNINSKALANYFSYIASKKELTKEVILEILSPEQYNHLIKLWENNPNSIAQKILSTREKFKTDKTIEKFFKYYDNLDETNVIPAIRENPEKIYLISDKKILLECIRSIDKISYKNINSYMQLDIDIITEVSKKDPEFDIKSIPQSFFEIDIRNNNDKEKIKKLFFIWKNWFDYLNIISELAVSIWDENLFKLIYDLTQDENMKPYKSFFESLANYKNQMDNLTPDDFKTSYNNLLKERNKDDIIKINLYIYKNWISGKEELIINLLKNYWLDDFPWIHKHLYENTDFAIKLISKYPKEFKNLSSKLQQNDRLIDTFLDSSIEEKFEYKKILSVIDQIELGKNIWVVILVYDKLTKKYGEEKVNNLFLHPKMSQKMQVFFKNLEWTTYSEWQKETLKKISWVFDKLIWEFEIARDTISSFQKKYEKIENKEKDDMILKKIEKITWFNKEKNKEILEIIKKPISDENSRILIWLLKKFTDWDNKKVTSILKSLQDLQIENIEKELNDDSQMLRKKGIRTDIIDEIITKNPRLKEEDYETYKKRISELVKKENKWLDEEGNKKIDSYVNWKINIDKLKNKNENIDLYISYLENPEKFKNFDEYKESKITEIEISNSKNQDKIETPNYSYDPYSWSLQINLPNWKQNIPISPEEKDIIYNNEKARKNLVNFYKFFKELNLESVWTYRKELLVSIWDINIKADNSDFINDEELRKLWNNILTFITNIENKQNWVDSKQKIELNNIASINKSLRDFSWANSMLSSWKSFNIIWEDKLAAYLRSRWIIRWAYFHINEFRKYI